jgi:hypothetical protein
VSLPEDAKDYQSEQDELAEKTKREDENKRPRL